MKGYLSTDLKYRIQRRGYISGACEKAVMRKAGVRLEQIGLEYMEERIWDSPREGIEVGINLMDLVYNIKVYMGFGVQ